MLTAETWSHLTGYFIERMALEVNENRRVVDQDIDPAERLHRFRRHPRGIFFPRTSTFSDGLATLRSNLLTALSPSRTSATTTASSASLPGGADVPRSTGNDGDLAPASRVHLRKLEWWNAGILE